MVVGDLQGARIHSEARGRLDLGLRGRLSWLTLLMSMKQASVRMNSVKDDKMRCSCVHVWQVVHVFMCGKGLCRLSPCSSSRNARYAKHASSELPAIAVGSGLDEGQG